MKGHKKGRGPESPEEAVPGSEQPVEPGGTVAGAESAVGAVPDAAAQAREAERAALENRFVRLQADFDNFRRRAVREREEAAMRARAELLAELLPAVDHFDMALASAADHDAPAALVDGFRLVNEQLLGALRRCGVEPFDALGAEFDPQAHEAVSHVPAAEAAGRVIAQTRRGFRLGGRLLRPAHVVVSSGAAAVESASECEAAGGEGV